MENTKTIRDLLNVNLLSDGDFLPVSQPNVFNVITQQNGDTRKITVAEIADYITLRQQKESVGEYHYLAFQPTSLWLAKKRYLVLNYQILQIAQYQDLFDLKWVGSSANATADFWYKCNSNGTRNASGLYFRVEDGRGMFFRGAGTNAVFKMANNAPYEGNEIGTCNQDRLQDHLHKFVNQHGNNQGLFESIASRTSDGYSNAIVNGALQLRSGDGNSGALASFQIGSVWTGRRSDETAPVWTAVLACISY